MSWAWLALLAEPADTATAQAAAVDLDDRPAGWLVAWGRRVRPAREARRVDDRIIDAEGPPAWVSLVLPPDGVRLPFDDLAVQQARRATLARPAADAVSTLLSDASRFEGAITVLRGPSPAALRDDPFARVFPGRILRIEAGLLGHVAPPCGPTIERYGSHEPWPWDRFGS
jgi:hypothetical protein